MASTLVLPLFQRYHATATARCKSELAKLGLKPAPADPAAYASEADMLKLTWLDDRPAGCDEAAVLAAATAIVNRALGKAVDANYWVGAQLGGSVAFAEAVARVHAAVLRQGEGSGHEDALCTACLPPTRWTLCLGVLRLYSPQQVAEVTKVLQAELGCEYTLRFSFEGMRCLGPTKLTAGLAPDDAVVLGKLAARLHSRLEPWIGGKPPGPHTTLVKFTYPFGDKKAKAVSAMAAKQLSLHKLNWNAELAQPFAVPNVGPLAVGLHEMHTGGGAMMGNSAYVVHWRSSNTDESAGSQPIPATASENLEV